MSNQNAPPEIWQVDVNGQIYETNFKELAEWIAEGALLRQDKVRRGNLRWLEAGKISLLHGFFNAKELGTPLPTVFNETNVAAEQALENIPPPDAQKQSHSFQNLSEVPNENINSQFEEKTQNLQNSIDFQLSSNYSNNCHFHSSEEVKFVCESCSAKFCKTCPKSYGRVKICPLCGEMCKPFADFQKKQQTNFQYQSDLQEGFGFGDFGKALTYPFKFRFSLISGAILFMFFSLAQSAGAMGGILMIVAALSSVMMANALTFGCLANTLDNFSQGNLSKDFMPRFDDFDLWDDVVHPFFLSIGAYLVSFGLLFVLVLGMVWYTFNTKTSQQNLNLNQITQQVKQATKDKRINENGEMILDESEIPNKNKLSSEENVQNLEKNIQQQRNSQLESVVGKDSDAAQNGNFELLQNSVKAGGLFVILAFGALLWGLFYFPAACAVAGYTRSFSATINPLMGLDTIRRMGVEYLKILVMCLFLGIMSGLITGILNAVFSPFDLPGIGNLPAKVIGSLFTFYFSIVFAVILGFALYKNSAKLSLFR